MDSESSLSSFSSNSFLGWNGLDLMLSTCKNKMPSSVFSGLSSVIFVRLSGSISTGVPPNNTSSPFPSPPFDPAFGPTLVLSVVITYYLFYLQAQFLYLQLRTLEHHMLIYYQNAGDAPCCCVSEIHLQAQYSFLHLQKAGHKQQQVFRKMVIR